MSPKHTEELTYSLISNTKIEELTDKHSDKRKQRLEFYREIKRMEPSRSRLIKEMIEFYENLIMAKTEIMKWISAIKSLLYPVDLV